MDENKVLKKQIDLAREGNIRKVESELQFLKQHRYMFKRKGNKGCKKTIKKHTKEIRVYWESKNDK